jgi:CBS domain-containing protein
MKIGELAASDIVSVGPDALLRHAAQAMTTAKVGMVVVLDDERLAGVMTERDVLRTVAESMDPDKTPVGEVMTRDVITVEPDWEVYEAAAEMAARNIRHLVVAGGDRVVGVVSIRDVLLAGQRVQLADGHWAVLRDPLNFTVRERRKLQRYLLELRGNAEADADLTDMMGLLIGVWSFDADLPPDAETLASLPPEDLAAVREAVLAELPELERAVHPAPGWRRRSAG